jgi:hypothetical protein
MNCSSHLSAEAQGICNACGKPLCAECLYKVKGKPYCQDCIVQGAEWAPIIKGRRFSSSTPKWAAFCAIIPGIGAVFNNEYLKAIVYFSIFAWLVMMSADVNGIFGFAAAVFLLFTMFDAYRMAEANARRDLEFGIAGNPAIQDKNTMTWGVLLIVMGVLFLLIKIIPQNILSLLWPMVFILLGAFLVFYAFQERQGRNNTPGNPINTGVDSPDRKEGI